MNVSRTVVRAVAAWRLTELVVADEVTRPVRERVTGRWPGTRLAYLLSCRTCVAVWAAAATQLLPDPVTEGLAVAAATMWITDIREGAAQREFQRKVTARGLGQGERGTG